MCFNVNLHSASSENYVRIQFRNICRDEYSADRCRKVISYQGLERAFPTGGHAFPGIDDLHIAKEPYPKTWDDYKKELIPNAWKVLLSRLRSVK